MNSLFEKFAMVSVVMAIAVTADGAFAQDGQLLRFLSIAIRDRQPTALEAKEFSRAEDKAATLEDLVDTWLASPEHQERVRRHFNDMFGIETHLYLSSEEFDLFKSNLAGASAKSPADLTEDGVYHLNPEIKPTCGEVVSVDAWWSDVPVRMCSTSTSREIKFPGDVVCTRNKSVLGIYHASCGCGPDQMICYPLDLKGNVVASVVKEFANRGLHAYENDLSWLDLLGGATFFGDRWLYHYYLYQQKILVFATLPSVAELALLKSLPIDARTLVTPPPSNAERAGVVTMPGFLHRFNNFRSRIRVLTEQLLCKDVDGSLNTDGIQSFVNPDLSPFDLSHGTQEGCATCHFGMDNMGSTLLGWNDSGFFTQLAVGDEVRDHSQLGHVFGEDGSGPGFLMNSYVERADGFDACMAKKVWEGFSGSRWDGLAPEHQAAFAKTAALGPRALIRSVLTSSTLKALRMPKEDPAAGGARLDFTRDIAPILEASCSGTSCHSAGTALGARYEYLNDAEVFRAVPGVRISNGSMPPAASGKALSAKDRDKLVEFLGAEVDR